jgi:uncharacterized membrane protein
MADPDRPAEKPAAGPPVPDPVAPDPAAPPVRFASPGPANTPEAAAVSPRPPAGRRSGGLTAEDRAEINRAAADRMTYFSDAVVAIAITLLALDLPLPHGATNRALLDSLGSHWSSYSVFLIGFVVIWAHWASHRQLFRLNRKVSQLNMVWLLAVVITPFATRVMTLQHSHGIGVRFSVYALVQILGWVAILAMTRELARSHLFRPGTPAATAVGDPVQTLTAIGMFALSIPVAFFTSWAFLFWIFTTPATNIVRRIVGDRVPAPDDDDEV